jgi:hypothetical protein
MMAEMVGNLRVNLVVSTPPLMGLRWRIGAKLLSKVCWIMGARLVIGLDEPQCTIGTLEPRRKRAA